MALIERHPDVTDYFVELGIDELRARGGAADLVESGHIVLLRDVRLDVDVEAIGSMSKTIDMVEDRMVRRKLKKLVATQFFGPDGAPAPIDPADPVRQAVVDVLCRGDQALYRRVSAAVRAAHEEALRIFELAFPGYDAFRFIPSLRLTRTMFENLHWDNHQIEDDFHQARVFANLDSRPRIWHVGEQFPVLVRKFYREHDLGRFAGRDPNELLDYINGDVLGGQVEKWRDTLPRHRIAFDPGEVWLGESRLVSHQIYYGEAALVYMWFVKTSSMADPANRFNERLDAIHREMAETAAA